MKLIIQRVKEASVVEKESGKVVGKIGKGLFILLGVKKGDTVETAEKLANKVSKMRIMADQEQKMNLSIRDANEAILVVSQFTLYANTKDGNRPSFVDAAIPEDARRLYEHFIRSLQKIDIKVQTGSFGSYMEISSLLDGPVTIVLEE